MGTCLLILVLANMPVNPYIFAVLLVGNAVWLFLLMRIGLLAATLSTFASSFILIRFPTTLDASAWYAPYGFAALTIFAVIVVYAFRFSLGGRPLIAASHLDD